jgi:hypothetical protein
MRNGAVSSRLRWRQCKPPATFERDPRAHTRRALIYAIAKEGHATLLTAALIEKLLSLKSNGTS